MNPVDQALSIPFFDGLAARHRAALASHARVSTFLEDEFVFRQDGHAATFWVLLEGRIALDVPSPHGDRVIATLNQGDILGFSWLFAPHRWQFDARAMTLVTAVEFDGAAIRPACEDDHELGFELMRRFARIVTSRLQHTRIQLLDLYA